ncbi:MAG: sugar phosphate isomerase/epimerase [Bryobacterales bacterium]|nr:sugar phosphate isomerase/epimerase [Bryobacterales bacterium]
MHGTIPTVMQRREFLGLIPAAALGAADSPFLKSICGGIFPREMPLTEQFRRARDAGFAGIEIRLGHELRHDTPLEQAARLAEEARKTGVVIVSLWVSQALSAAPLNHEDPEVRARGVAVLHQAIDLARTVNCGALLIVPGRLGDGPKFIYGYQDTWNRLTAEFRKVIPHAARARVLLTPENIWNKFLVSPLEMRSFIDQFSSPWLQSHFDIGNVMQFGYPQDWIQTLGPRIKRVHVKDYKLSQRDEQGRFVDLLEGDVDWPAVMSALKKAGYRGFLSPEMGPRSEDPDYLGKVSRALDQILAMA